MAQQKSMRNRFLASSQTATTLLPMPRLAGCTIATPQGNLGGTFSALVAGRGQPRQLPGGLTALLTDLIATALDGRKADLVVLATTKAECDLWCEAVLTESDSVVGGPGWLAGELGRAFNATAFAVSAACASGPVALGVAARWLMAGRAKRVVVAGGDRIGAFVRDGFAGLKALAPVCRPFDAGREGLALGETAAAVVLEAATNGKASEGLFLQGWGASMDANHLTGPSRDGSGLAAACRQALKRAGATAPALVVAHGTGTRYNDDSESLAYAQACPRAPVVGFKGLLGHSLGACGVTEFALAAEIRQRGETPGTVGLVKQGCAGTIRVLPPGRHALGSGPILCANAGFGGLNGATVVGDAPPAALAKRRPRMMGRVELSPQGWTRGRSGATITVFSWSEPGDKESLPRLTAKEVLGKVDPSWGRMDLSCRALVTLGQLLAPLPADCAVVLLTEAGCAATDRVFERERRTTGANPQLFAYTLPTAPIGEASIRLGLHGPGFAVCGADDRQGRLLADDLLADGSPAVLLARIEADRPPHLAWAEMWRAGD
jgi:3-oxoacyl-(acyl-carrier-protein) synthase